MRSYLHMSASHYHKLKFIFLVDFPHIVVVPVYKGCTIHAYMVPIFVYRYMPKCATSLLNTWCMLCGELQNSNDGRKN